ncbi:MAG: DNA-directed RNA polymerase subunit omega [Clostridiales bacterium]|nr:DNA-directed RNA polymerase subunit omega [Clostridiales bacterium]
MLYPSVNQLRDKVDSKYSLVILTAKRAREIIDGSPKLIDTDIEKPVSIAAIEIAEGLVKYKREEKNNSINGGV